MLALRRVFSRGVPAVRSKAFSVKPSALEFTVGTDNGFLPRESPLVELPAKFKELESLLQRMPIKTRDGKEGLLKFGTFGDTLMAELPDYTAEIEKLDTEKDSRLLAALFRDYTFAASSYLLEPCDIEYRKSKTYGLGRQTLPRKLAVPLNIVSKKIGAKPFMEYALSYALYNYAVIDPKHPDPCTYENMRLIRTFDGSEAEHGFILVHVAMVRFSGRLVKYARAVLDAASWRDRKALNEAYTGLLAAENDINRTMETMWTRSSAQGYNDFRTFIMGTKNQPMFPQGVLYEGVSEERTQFRGESGANDTMVPTLDNLLQVTDQMPENPLTEVLKDFRAYRPGNHQEWLTEVKNRADQHKVLEFTFQDPLTSVLYLQCLDLVREFRMRHWNFTKEYIIKYSTHAVGTGGSPIVTWLPNQLAAVINLITKLAGKIDASKLDAEHAEILKRLINTNRAQGRVLSREVESLKEKYPSSAINVTIN